MQLSAKIDAIEVERGSLVIAFCVTRVSCFILPQTDVADVRYF